MDIFKKYKKYKKNRKILEVKFIDSNEIKINYAIIIPYRNDKDNVRKKQLEKFIEFSKKILKIMLKY